MVHRERVQFYENHKVIVTNVSICSFLPTPLFGLILGFILLTEMEKLLQLLKIIQPSDPRNLVLSRKFAYRWSDVIYKDHRRFWLCKYINIQERAWTELLNGLAW